MDAAGVNGMIKSSANGIFVLLVTAVFALAGCSTAPPRHSVPVSLTKEVQIPGIPEARFWGDDIPKKTEHRINTLTKEEIRANYPALFGQPHNYLAISGGGPDGAFGAGLLVGWTIAASG